LTSTLIKQKELDKVDETKESDPVFVPMLAKRGLSTGKEIDCWMTGLNLQVLSKVEGVMKPMKKPL